MDEAFIFYVYNFILCTFKIVNKIFVPSNYKHIFYVLFHF